MNFRKKVFPERVIPLWNSLNISKWWCASYCCF